MDRELGFKVKLRLLEQQKTQVWLAKQLGISRQSVNNVIHGARNLKLEELLEHYAKTGEVKKELYLDKESYNGTN